MKYKSLEYNNTVYTDQKIIENILLNNGFEWLVRCEFDNAKLKIHKNTIIWNDGIFYYGTWIYGIWKGGEWRYGTWENGIWESGIWKKGTWVSGIK